MRDETFIAKVFFDRFKFTCLMISILFASPAVGYAQGDGEFTSGKLAELGFENVRWTEDSEERVYTIENNMYKIQAIGIAKAIGVIQKEGLPQGKRCKVIVTNYNVPQVALTYNPLTANTDSVTTADWDVSYQIGKESWDKVKKQEKKNSSLFKVDVLVYPKLYYKNLVITQIYQACLEISPAIEVSLWPGSRLTAQVIFPAYNDGYPGAQENIRPGYLTLEQHIRLPYNIWAKGVIGVFNRNSYGGEISAMRPFKDERFSIEAKFGLVGIGYFNSFDYFRYNGEIRNYWSVGGNFYLPYYNTHFSARVEKYLLNDIGVYAEMVRHFKYVSVGFYAEKANKVSSNGGFKFIVALPPYKYKRRGHIPRISTGIGMGTTYNAGNESTYYLMPTSTADDNILKRNQFNPYFIESELSN